MYNVVWAYNNETGSLSSYHPLLSNGNTVHHSDSTNHRSEVKESLLTPELALPQFSSTSVSRNQASINMLSCLDTLTHFPEVNLTSNEDENAKNVLTKSYSKEDFTAVNRFDNHGGGWGYSGHSIEAIRYSLGQ